MLLQMFYYIMQWSYKTGNYTHLLDEFASLATTGWLKLVRYCRKYNGIDRIIKNCQYFHIVKVDEEAIIVECSLSHC